MIIYTSNVIGLGHELLIQSGNIEFTKYNVHSNNYEDFIDIKANVVFEMVFTGFTGFIRISIMEYILEHILFVTDRL